MNPQQGQQNTPQQDPSIPFVAASLTKAIAYTENGGAPDPNNESSGKTGETKSIFQYTPDTWKKDAGDILGNPNAPMTPDNETSVANGEITNWLKQGYSPSQIASMWNAGPGEPNAYTGRFSDGSSSQGVNRQYGVKYDVPGYVSKVVNYAKQFFKEGTQSPNQQPSNQGNQSNQTSQSTQQKKIPRPIVDAIKKASVSKNSGKMRGLARGSGTQIKQPSNRGGLLGSSTS